MGGSRIRYMAKSRENAHQRQAPKKRRGQSRQQQNNKENPAWAGLSRSYEEAARKEG